MIRLTNLKEYFTPLIDSGTSVKIAFDYEPIYDTDEEGNKVESNIITFEVTDSRGFITETALEKGFVDYVKLTCNMAVGAPTTAGELTITAKGKYFNGSFGSQSNSLFVYYRYKVNNGSYGNWISMSSTVSNNTYTATASLTGLDYQNSYTFQTKAVDKLATVETAEKKVKTTPIFDWGENDFNFNVPVVAPSLNGHRIFENKILCIKKCTS